ncbi:HEAT repeat domain-containing protein [Gemmatimonas sp.]|jgi:hypothetical protein|uniref:HEAT repeat domain-containing protein n=1 Tax=Gemmatimonas sp. TaxID=1962908 RepID=UPI0037C0B2FA
MTTRGHEPSHPPIEVVAIEDALRAFAKALRAVQLYLPNNPMRAAAIEQARAAFERVWPFADPLELQIKESSFVWDGRIVYHDAERGTVGLPWLLYRDGLRALHLRSGFESTDLDALLTLFQKARTAAPDDDDIVTLLWVADLATVECRHVEYVAGGDLPLEPGQDRPGVDRVGVATVAPGVAPLAAPSVEAAVHGDRPPSGLVRVDDFETTLYFLDAHEVTYLQEELKREYGEDHRRLVLESLFDIIDGQFSSDSQLEALLTVDRLLIEFLSTGEYELVAMALHEASTTVRRLVSDDRVMTALRDLPIRMSEPAVILQLLQALDESAKTPVASLLERLFVELQPSALEPMVAWLGGATASPARAAIERAAARLAGEHTSELSRLLDHENESVVRGAIRLTAQLATPAAVPGLARVLRRHDRQLRVEALSVLGAIASPTALQAVERAIDDTDRDVRVAALRVLATRAHRAALPRLLEALRRKELRSADLSEKTALFEAVASVCGDAGVPELDALLNARGLLGPRSPVELRACAARALGMIGSADAMNALQRAADTKDVIVRSAVARAMRGTA